MLNENFESNSNDSGQNQFMLNLAEGVITTNSVDPVSNNLVAIFGTGYEKNNREAILNWAIETTDGWPIFPDRPLPILNEYFKDRLVEIAELHSS